MTFLLEEGVSIRQSLSRDTITQDVMSFYAFFLGKEKYLTKTILCRANVINFLLL